jgi:hypothetical protein
LPDIAPEGFFLFPKVKTELADFLLSQDSFKMRWVGVMRNIAEEESATAFERCMSTATSAFGSAITILRKVKK